MVCLADYKCCRKANQKEAKKGKATFVIEKGEVRERERERLVVIITIVTDHL